MANSLWHDAGLVSRRRCLQGLAAGALSVPLGSAAATAGVRQKNVGIRSCIVLFHYGGPSQLETFDPKPEAPAEVRGEYGVIETAVPGVLVSEHLPLTARVMNRVAQIRSMHHPMRNHNSAAAEVLTGRPPAGGDLELLADDVSSFPTLGSAVGFGLGDKAHLLPYVALPYTMYNVVQLPGQTPGFLGGRYDRFQIQGDPGRSDFRVSALDPPAGRSAGFAKTRELLLQQLEATANDVQDEAMQAYRSRAFELIESESLRRGFDMSLEPAATRERYGRHLFGQSVLLARRLVEEGVNVIAVFNGERNGQTANWDSHENLFPRHKELIPPADQAFAALIEDLEQRGLLESTLVVSMAEFGRTPRINGSAGRDHWPDCYTVLLAGGGVNGGMVYGASDRIAAYPERDPTTPGDLVATILSRFGIDPQTVVRNQTGRPFHLADGLPVESLFA
jgi:hypothetical protein